MWSIGPPFTEKPVCQESAVSGFQCSEPQNVDLSRTSIVDDCRSLCLQDENTFMKAKHLLVLWMLVVAGLTISYVSLNTTKHPELVGLVMIIFFSFLGITVGLSQIIKKLDDKESKQ